MHKYNITAVINGHNEGMLASSSLQSFLRCAQIAEDAGVKTELIAVLDNADSITKEVFEEFASRHTGLRVLCVEFGDSGFARNTAGAVAEGKWVAFLDGDDLWSGDWLVEAFKAAEAEKRQVVWHPEVNVYFGINPHLFIHMDMDNTQFDIATLASQNMWTALAFVSRDFLRQVPYTGTNIKEFIGYEDWSWNVDVISNGAIHKTVMGTAHAIRTKHTSLVKTTSAGKCIPRPSPYFKNLLIDRVRPSVQQSLAHNSDMPR